MRIITSEAECRQLWEQYSPKETLWDDWDICNSILLEHEKYLFLHHNGLLPLIFDESNQTTYLFGSPHQERRRFWFDINDWELYKEHIPKPAKLFDMDIEPANTSDTNYYLDLTLTPGFEALAQQFSAKRRKNLRLEFEKLKELTITWDDTVDVNAIITWQKKRFGEESDYADPQFVHQIKHLISTLKEQDKLIALHVASTEHVGEYFAALHNQTLYVLNGGYNRDIDSLGKYLYKLLIDKAVSHNAKEVDFLIGDPTGWKTQWHLQERALHTIIL